MALYVPSVRKICGQSQKPYVYTEVNNKENYWEDKYVKVCKGLSFYL